jgi:hypothetical protein
MLVRRHAQRQKMGNKKAGNSLQPFLMIGILILISKASTSSPEHFFLLLADKNTRLWKASMH